ncbi:MAG: family 10 glycosylhydrolase [Planctomycetota bacterium]
MITARKRLNQRARFQRFRPLGWLALILLSQVTTGCHRARWGSEGPFGREGIRAVWVTRWDFKSPSDIAKVMDNCKTAGFNTVLFQVRGAGTALYRSRIEPWADELGGRDPGFDPLSVACAEAHKRGMKLHAWVNVIPGWHGDKPPTNRQQLYVSRPDWFWRDASGRRQPLGWYSSLNPCYPEVRKYLVGVMREIVSRYPVDGLHMDYIRFPNEWSKAYEGWSSVPDYPRDPRTLALFRKATGKSPNDAPGLWSQWRTDQVTQLVRDIRAVTLSARPRAALTAAVGPKPEEHKRTHFQDSPRWIAEGLVDGVFPMNYASDVGTFTQRLGAWSGARGEVPVVTGIMFDKRDPALVSEQVGRARQSTHHFCAFAYNSLFERLDRTGRPIMDEQSSSRAALRQRVIPHIRHLAGMRS